MGGTSDLGFLCARAEGGTTDLGLLRTPAEGGTRWRQVLRRPRGHGIRHGGVLQADLPAEADLSFPPGPLLRGIVRTAHFPARERFPE